MPNDDSLGPSIQLAEPTHPKAWLTPFLLDGAIGLGAGVVALLVVVSLMVLARWACNSDTPWVTQPVALFLRRLAWFSFGSPWAILPFTLFAAGFLFGNTPRNSWAKAARINTVNWCLLLIPMCLAEHVQRSDMARLLPWMLSTYPPTVLGVLLRHLTAGAAKGTSG